MGATYSPSGVAQKPAWQLVRSQLQTTLQTYLKQVETEAARLSTLTPRERQFIPQSLIDERSKAYEESKAANVAFTNAVAATLPEKFSSPPSTSPSPLLHILHHQGVKLGTQNYASMGSILLHLLRDWSAECEHVVNDVYLPIVKQLQERVPVREGMEGVTSNHQNNGLCEDEKRGAPRVLVPGSGLSRLAFELMRAGYQVECNEFSPFFATVTDYLFNHCREQHTIFPLAHVFSENWSLDNQYQPVQVPPA
eukprot:CAMPEP_0181320518 /NCGR_PEP_ID=MMETSP1101-20121128/18167_1 /TAXON_ID=46948 /ORGANISM="Rhodomonas abbreviata, Strain Caron Lab Isolate" /LENGTH=251 /DNA_ID=CAMNT_0023428229 /DNA_START=525 /DNA_END=1276 /DNA_ORIENTATION=-